MRFLTIKKPKLSVLAKYILSYMLLFTVLFCVFLAVIYQNIVVRLRTDALNSVTGRLDQVQAIIDNRLTGLVDTAGFIGSNPRLIPYMVTASGYTTREAIDELRMYHISQSFLEDICLYIRGVDFMYSSMGVDHMDTFLQVRYVFSDWPRDDIITALESADEPILLVRSAVHDLLTPRQYWIYVCPVRGVGVTPHATALYFMKADMIAEIVDDLFTDVYSYVYVLDDSQNILFSSNSQDEFPFEDIRAAVDFSDPENLYEVPTDQGVFQICVNRSQSTGLYYISVFSYKQFIRQINRSVRNFTILALVILLLGILLALYLSYRNYNPIKRLFVHVRDELGDNEKPAVMDELMLLEEYFNRKVAESTTLEKQLAVQLPVINDKFIIMLMKGRYDPGQAENDIYRDIRSKLSGLYYFVLVITLDEKKLRSSVVKDLIIEKVQQPVDGCRLYCVEFSPRNTLAILAALHHNLDFQNNRQQFCAVVEQRIRSCTAVDFTIGYGNVYDDIHEIKYSYAEAAAMAEQIAFKGVGALPAAKDSNDMKDYFEGTGRQIMMLCQTIRNGDSSSVDSVLHDLFTSIPAENAPVSIVKVMCLEIVINIMKTVTDMGIRGFDEELDGQLQFLSCDELQHGLSPLVKRICDHVHEREKSRSNELIQRIIQYIDGHYWESDFSQVAVADHFNMSSSFLSQFFSEHKGYSFIQYVTDLKLKEVKRRLVETEDSITTIICSVGYTDRPNFMRRFKKIEGVTMGQYRKMNRAYK